MVLFLTDLLQIKQIKLVDFPGVVHPSTQHHHLVRKTPFFFLLVMLFNVWVGLSNIDWLPAIDILAIFQVAQVTDCWHVSVLHQ